MKDILTLKELLIKNRISVRRIASGVNFSITTVNQVINSKYPGSDDTAKKIIDYANFLLIKKEDLNRFIYTKSELYEKVFMNLFRDKKYSADEAEEFYNVFLVLKKYNNEKSKIESD
jgi:transcriptional regulator with XRE-family HTH domain